VLALQGRRNGKALLLGAARSCCSSQCQSQPWSSAAAGLLPHSPSSPQRARPSPPTPPPHKNTHLEEVVQRGALHAQPRTKGFQQAEGAALYLGIVRHHSGAELGLRAGRGAGCAAVRDQLCRSGMLNEPRPVQCAAALNLRLEQHCAPKSCRSTTVKPPVRAASD
jgi:hypothetical protein